MMLAEHQITLFHAVAEGYELPVSIRATTLTGGFPALDNDDGSMQQSPQALNSLDLFFPGRIPVDAS